MNTPVPSSRARMVFAVACAIALIVASLSVAVYREQQYQKRFADAARVQALILADTATAALAFGDRESLRQYVNALRVDDEVDAVGVYGQDGALVASFARSPLPRTLIAARQLGAVRGQIAVVVPVVEQGAQLGAVYLRDRAEPPLRRLTRYLGPGLLVLMAALMFLFMARDGRALIRANRELTAQIAERAKAEEALRQSQKMEAIGRLTGGIAHDFNNMLAIVMGSLDLLLRRHADADPKLVRLATNAMEGAKRAAALTQRLLAFSRRQPLRPASVDVARTVNEIADLLRRTLGEGVMVEAVSAGGLWRAYIDAPQLETAIVNLAINARDAMPDGGKLTIETANTYLDRAYVADEPDVTPGQYVLLAITDSGCGMTPEVQAQVFEPFFTTKPPGLGTGLGLSQVLGFIKQSGGHVRLYSEVGVGTTVKLYLPRSTEEAEHPKPAPAAPQPSAPRPTVLLVEDEDGVRAFAVEALGDLGYGVVAADGAQAALRELDAHPEVSLLLTDVVMPEMDGRRLAQEVLKRRPELKVIFMTGYTRNAVVHNGVLDADAHLVTKPFTVGQLGAELEAVLNEAWL